MSKKCTCNEKRGSMSCRNCSGYKLVFMLIRDKGSSDKIINPAWYSIPKEEKKGAQILFYNYMLPRALKSKWAGRIKMILLYQKGEPKPLYTYKP